MSLSVNPKQGRLPKRFPVGTTFIVEGRGDPDGRLCVFSRYVVFPGGERINLGADLSSHATRNRRTRGPRAVLKSSARGPGKRSSEQSKKITATAGTSGPRHR